MISDRTHLASGLAGGNAMNRRNLIALAAAGAAGALAAPASGAASTPAASQTVKTGGSRLITLDTGHKVWTKRVGRGPLKVLLLHGGPGFSHDYLECFEDFLPPAGIEIYFYDQLGCGYSERPEDPSLWTLERYLGEVEQVRAGLGLDRFVLYGHSWGGILGYEYALRYGERLGGLVISNMTAGIADYVRYMAELRGRLSAEDQATLARYEASGRTDAPEYQGVLFGKLYAEHVLRLPEFPEPVARTFGKVNPVIYNQMQGPNEFVVTGSLKDWSRWTDLPRIRARTLVMAARHDEMEPAQMRRVASLIPGSRLFMSERGSHLTMYDDQEAYFAALLDFLKGLPAHG
jgi:proline iminopeptidase